MLTFEYRVCPDVRAEGLGCGLLDVWSPCHPSIEDDTELCNTIYKWDVPSIQLKVVPRHSTSSREVDRLVFPSLIFCARADTLTPQQWGHAGVCSIRDAHVSLLRIHRYRPRTEQGLFQVPRGHHLCINCTVLGQGRNLMALLPLLSWAKKVRLLLKLYIFYLLKRNQSA
jgi:hypothetical protein